MVWTVTENHRYLVYMAEFNIYKSTLQPYRGALNEEVSFTDITTMVGDISHTVASPVLQIFKSLNSNI